MNGWDICVLIPHYNNLPGLLRTLSSLEPGDHYHVLIVDDGSSPDQRPDTFHFNTLKNPPLMNIHLVQLSLNQGIEYALNAGLKELETKIRPTYIMRLDAGDLCEPGRITRQRKFLEENPDICLVGSDVLYVDTQGKPLYPIHFPTSHKALKKHMLIAVSFIHSAVMFRASALKDVGYYSHDYPAAEDYAFFYKFVNTCQTASIPEVLTRVEWNPLGISSIRRREQLTSRLRLTWKYRKWDYRFFYGISRLILLLILPYKFIERIKKILYR